MQGMCGNMRMKNKKVEARYLFFIFLFLICSLIHKGYSMDDETTFWQSYQKWFEYKKLQPLTELQRNAILYFEKANAIFEIAESTWGVSINHIEPALQDALKTVNKCRIEFAKLKPPPIAKKHYDASLKLIEIIRKYHVKRINNPDSSDLQLLARSAIPYESIQYSEYFNILRKVGLFDNAIQEMAALGLQPSNKFYEYSQEISAEATPQCPRCFLNLRKLPIRYGKIENEELPNKEPLRYLPGAKEITQSFLPSDIFVTKIISGLRDI